MTYVVTATGGGSRNPVTFGIDASSTSSACTISDATVTFGQPGQCVIDADQAGQGAARAATAPHMVCPTSELADTPRGGDVAVIALMGVLGAALSATLAVQKLRGTAAPYSVPVGLAFFKLPAGALTAIAGLVLIKGDFVPGFSQLDSQGQILAYAIAFGVAQHLVTRFVDQRADDVLSNLPTKEHPAVKPKQAGQATQPASAENPASSVAA